VQSALPARRRSELDEAALFAPGGGLDPTTSDALATVRAAMSERRKLRMRYTREDGEPSERVVRPLGAFFWGRCWTLTAWCELRRDFRNFRLDRVVSLAPLDETFVEEPGRSLREFLRRIGLDADGVLER
jgi:predicted DNA-binding transcriptional regulator YafY